MDGYAGCEGNRDNDEKYNLFHTPKLLHNQDIVASLLPCLVEVLDARKGLVVFNPFYNSLPCKAQHFSVAGNGHYLFFHTANIGHGLQLTRKRVTFCVKY